MPYKIKMKIDKAGLARIIDRKKRLLHKNINSVVRQEVIPHLITLVMVGYDGLSERMDMLPEDPTNPANWREEFREQLATDLSDTYRVEGDKIIFGMFGNFGNVIIS